jgi:hypothetical protein
MEQGVRDHLTSLIDALGVELRIAKVTIPSIRDGVHMASTAAFTETVMRICATAQQLATAASISMHDQLTLDLDATEDSHGAV